MLLIKPLAYQIQVIAISLPNPSDRYIIGSRKEKFAVKVRPFIPDRLFYSLAAKKIHSK